MLQKNNPMFRFTIRDVLWLMVVVALVIGWMVHVRSERDWLNFSDIN